MRPIPPFPEFMKNIAKKNHAEEKKMTKFTISDIARIAGVSLATVSRALNNKPRISTVTRDKINTQTSLLKDWRVYEKV